MINFCRPGLQAMIGNGGSGRLDFLFANEEEAQVWCGSTDFAEVSRQMSQLARVVCLTRSARGCVVLEGSAVTEVPAANVRAIDTNGAGDMFAGAFLYAVTEGHSFAHAAWLANQAAGQVVAQFGNRLDVTAMAGIKQRYLQFIAD